MKPSPKVILAGALVVVLFILLIVITVVQKSATDKSKASVTPTPQAQTSPPVTNDITTTKSGNLPAGVILKVGDENIYQADLANMESHYLSTISEQVRADMRRTLARESVILQEASKDGLVQLNATIYNSPDKNYGARAKAVRDAKAKLESKIGKISGSVVSIWFLNVTPGQLGYERSKQVALQKITILHNRVKAGQMTMEQAADAIRNDTELEQLNPTYKSNAEYKFDTSDVNEITLFSTINTEIAKLQPGQTSEILTAKGSVQGVDSDKEILYAFGQVTANTLSSNGTFIDTYIENKLNGYTILE